MIIYFQYVPRMLCTLRNGSIRSHGFIHLKKACWRAIRRACLFCFWPKMAAETLPVEPIRQRQETGQDRARLELAAVSTVGLSLSYRYTSLQWMNRLNEWTESYRRGLLCSKLRSVASVTVSQYSVICIHVMSVCNYLLMTGRCRR